jgi:hypothetical protein
MFLSRCAYKLFTKPEFSSVKVAAIPKVYTCNNREASIYQIQQRTFKNFGHKQQKTPRLTLFFGLCFVIYSVGSCINWHR